MSGEITAPMTVQEQIQYAKNISQADILPKSYRNKPADIIIAMGLGQSMGLSPMESLYRINVINGKPTASAELIAAQVRKAGHKLRLSKDEKRQSVTCTIIRKDDPEAPFTATRDKAWAHAMGLDRRDRNGNPSNYVKQPMTMLTWRAITACAREACPEALYGVAYTPDEMHDMDPVLVDATVERQNAAESPDADDAAYEVPVDNLGPIRELLRPFAAKLGYDLTRATGCVLDFAGVGSMDQMTDEMVSDACEYMQGIIDEPAMQ